MISIYSSAFNLIKNNFDYFGAINKFCSFAEEVVIAVNKSEDDTLKKVHDLKFNNLKVIETNIDYSDPLLDGKIKNIALQNTSLPIKISLDMDEYIPLWQKNIWNNLGQQLAQDNEVDCYMIPSINLYKSKEKYASINPKWYLHKSGLIRGPVHFGLKNGFLDIEKSDGCELIYPDHTLAKSRIAPCDIKILRSKQAPFVVHTGYLSVKDRILRQENFWNKHWDISSGGLQKSTNPTKEEDFNSETQDHLLDIE
jgi:hypothetical protein